jgi:hypothetical protein
VILAYLLMRRFDLPVARVFGMSVLLGLIVVVSFVVGTIAMFRNMGGL